MKSKTIFFTLFLMLFFVNLVSAVTYSENQEVTLPEGEEIYVQIQDVSYKMFLDPFLGDRVSFEVNGEQQDSFANKGGSIVLDNGIVISVIDIYQVGNKGYVKFKMSSQTSIQTPPVDDSISPREQQEINEKKFNITLVILLIISLIISLFITIFMINKNPLVPNIIIHSIVLLGSAIISVTNTFDTIRCLFSQYCSTSPIGLFFFVAFPSFFLSLFIVWKLVWKKEYGNKYSTNMSSGVIILSLLFWIFAFISEIIIQPRYDLPAFFGLALLIVPIGLSLYFILGIVGLFIDKSHK